MEYARLVSLFGYELDAEILRLMLRAEESTHRLSGVIAERADLLGQEREDVDDEASIVTNQTLALIAFHIERILTANVEILRNV